MNHTGVERSNSFSLVPTEGPLYILLLNIMPYALWTPKFGVAGMTWATYASYTLAFVVMTILYAKISDDNILNMVLPQKSGFYSSDLNTTSFNWWMETVAKGGQAKPEQGNATSFNWWFFTFTRIW